MARQPRFMTSTLYLYLAPANALYVRKEGAAKWGTFSNFINFLIAQSRRDKSIQKLCREYAAASYAPVEARQPKKASKKPSKKSGAKLKKALKKSKPARKKAKLRLVKRKAAKKPEVQAPQAA